MIFVPPLDAYKNTSAGRIRYLIDQITELSPISAEQVPPFLRPSDGVDRPTDSKNRVGGKPAPPD
jgi:hypothetical protein